MNNFNVAVSGWLTVPIFSQALPGTSVWSRGVRWQVRFLPLQSKKYAIKKANLIYFACTIKVCTEISNIKVYFDIKKRWHIWFRLQFWEEAGETYKVDLSALCPYARQCITRSVHITCVHPSSVLAKPAQICCLDLHTMSVQDLSKVQVGYLSIYWWKMDLSM